MLDESKFPPFLPESMCSERDIWVGRLNPHNPQLEVTAGPDIDTLQRAYRAGEFVTLRLASRVADMDDEDPSDDKGEVEVYVEELFKDEVHRTVNFLAIGELPFGSGQSNIWVWEYDDEGKAGADFMVSD